VKTFRHLILILFFTALVSLEIWHGFFRLDALAHRQRVEAKESLKRAQSELARSFAENLRAEREHARYLVKMPGAKHLLRTANAEEAIRMASRKRLEQDLSPYLLSFPIIDGLSLYDPSGSEKFRMMRLAGRRGGVGSLSEDLLNRREGLLAARTRALDGAAPDEVILSKLEIDRRRIEVPENDRQVLRYAALVSEDGETLGVLELTLYAAPLLDAVRSWKPWPGVVSALLDGDGTYLAHPERSLERTGAALLAARHPAAAAAILRGAEESREGNVLLLASPIQDGLAGWRLVAEVPDAALEAALVPLGREYLWVIGSMGATTLILLLAGALLLRLSIREVRLAESGRYLERVRRESDRYRALMEGAADMILIVAPEREVIREANALARRALGLTEADCPLDQILPPAHRAVFRERLAAAAAGSPADLAEIWLRGDRDRIIPASGRLAAIDLGNEQVVEVALRDLTREKEMERQVRISERLGSLGLLTAGVAHEINNPLEGIENYLALLDREGGDPAKRTRYLEMVRYGFRRIRDIVRDLSSFARPEVKGDTADLSRVVERALGMVSYDRAFRTVEVERRGLDRPQIVIGDPGRLEQVFINLLVNAARAMKSSGRISLSAQAVEGGPESAGPTVEVRVEDGGPGIPEELLGRIFDPFFTTGEGTGLGLSISYGIVRAHGGDLRAENRPEGGARFIVRLAAAPPGQRAAQALDPARRPAEGLGAAAEGRGR
jgi:PAS domain S-box-containing protein